MDRIEKNVEAIQDSIKSLVDLFKAAAQPPPAPPPIQPCLTPTVQQQSHEQTPSVSTIVTPVRVVTPIRCSPAATPAATPASSPIELQLPSHHRPPLPIPSYDNALPSSAIEDWPGKKSIMEVIEQNHKLAKVSRASTLSVKIARHAVFGESLMKKCTALGGRELPGLPRQELYTIKRAIFDLFPSYWKNVEDFEAVWTGCIDGIGQLCKRLRKN